MNCIPVTRLRMVFAFAGILMSSASSTARQLATACTVVHTPQMRCTNAHASRGSRPCMMVSIPRNCVDVAHALEIFPFSDCASMRRWPSMRVIGSTTTLVLAIVRLLLGRRLGYLVGAAAATNLREHRSRAVRGDPCGRPYRERQPDRVRAFHMKIGQGENVAGPLQPTSYRHHPFLAPSSSNVSTNCPASKCARREHWSWMRLPYANSGRPSPSTAGSRPKVREGTKGAG